MGRRIWIIPQRNIESADYLAARQNNCLEITVGIPPILKDKVLKQQLPCVYEEPDNVIGFLLDYAIEIKQLKERVTLLESYLKVKNE